MGETKQAGSALRQAGAMGVIGQRQQLVRQQQRADDLVACVGRVGGADGAHRSSSSRFDAMLVPRRTLAPKGLTDPKQRTHLIFQRRHRRCVMPGLMPMSPARSRECIALFKWSQREFSRRLSLGDRAGGAMSSGKYEIKVSVR